MTDTPCRLDGVVSERDRFDQPFAFGETPIPIKYGQRQVPVRALATGTQTFETIARLIVLCEGPVESVSWVTDDSGVTYRDI